MTSPLSDALERARQAAVARQTEGYANAVKAIRERLIQYAVSQFGPAAINDAGMEQFVQKILPAVLGGQRQVAALTDAYISSVIRADGGELTPGAVVDTSEVRGVDPAEVYMRPTIETRTALSKGAVLDSAVTAGLRRLASLIATDLQLAKTHSAQNVMARSGKSVHGFKRVLHGPGNCLKCVVTATRFYHKEALLPIHPGCNCDVEPLVGSKGADGIITGQEEALQAAHDLVRASGNDANLSAKGYQDLVVVHDHGELGPTLAIRGQNFTGSNDLPH